MAPRTWPNEATATPLEENELTTCAFKTSDSMDKSSQPHWKTLSFEDGMLAPSSNTESESGGDALDGPNSNTGAFRDRAYSWKSEGPVDLVPLPVNSFQSVRTYDEFEANEEAPSIDIADIEVTSPMPADGAMPDLMVGVQPFIQSPVMSPVMQPILQPVVLVPAVPAEMQWAPVQGMPWQMSPTMAAMPWPESPVDPMAQNQTQASTGSVAGSDGKTTVMWKNLPNNYTRDDLVALIDSEGFAGSYDFFYPPMDFTSNALVGYAFINFRSSEKADQFFYHFQGFNRWKLLSVKVSEVTWSKDQGLQVHIERYRNSPVMHPDVPDDVRPLLLQDGQRIPFPLPTKKIRAPHLKDCRARA